MKLKGQLHITAEEQELSEEGHSKLKIDGEVKGDTQPLSHALSQMMEENEAIHDMIFHAIRDYIDKHENEGMIVKIPHKQEELKN